MRNAYFPRRIDNGHQNGALQNLLKLLRTSLVLDGHIQVPKYNLYRTVSLHQLFGLACFDIYHLD